MRKKVIGLLILAGVFITGCGNQSVFDTKWTFDEAVINVGGEYRSINVTKWKDYEDGIVQIVDEDGAVYVTHYQNVVMIGK